MIINHVKQFFDFLMSHKSLRNTNIDNMLNDQQSIDNITLTPFIPIGKCTYLCTSNLIL